MPEPVFYQVRSESMAAKGSFEIVGGQGINSYIAAVPAGGVASIQLNSPSGHSIDLARFPVFRGPCGSDFGRVVVTWDALAGKTLVIILGRDLEGSLVVPT